MIIRKWMKQHNDVMKKNAFTRNLLTPALLLLGIYICAGCRDVSKVELIEDIDIYVNTIDQVHAEPYRLISRENFIGKAQELKQKIRALENARISVPQCALYLMELCALIQDGHTRIDFPFDQLTGTESAFPLKLKIINGNVYVLDNLGNEALPNFCSILEINGVPVETLLEKSSKLYNTSLDHAKRLMFEESFPLLLANYLDIHPPWAVKYEISSQVQVSELQEMTSEAYFKQRSQQSNRYRRYSIAVNDVEVPVLDLPGFSYGEAQDWESFIDTFFQIHKSSRYLVIDLRQNRGGSGYWGFYLLDYLTESAYRIAKKFVFKASKMGVLVGRETSGRVRFGSDPVTMSLPNSKLKGSIPVAIYQLPGNNPDRGVMPDVKVFRSIDDFHSGGDKEMETVQELIRKDMGR